jgi:hypothetical protein
VLTLLTTLENSAFSTWLVGSDSIWAFPTVLTLHTVGMMVLVGSSAVFDLRVLGAARAIPLGSLQVLFPLMWAGFWLNFVTGTMLFCAQATSKGTMPLFFVKMGLVALGASTVVLTRRTVYRPGPGAATVDGAARPLAVASLLTWVLAVVSGRLLGYVE